MESGHPLCVWVSLLTIDNFRNQEIRSRVAETVGRRAKNSLQPHRHIELSGEGDIPQDAGTIRGWKLVPRSIGVARSPLELYEGESHGRFLKL